MIEYKATHRIVTLPVSGVNICIADEGQGAPLFFVHGLSADLACWNEVLDHFKTRYRCIAIDLPGHGRSEKLLKEYSVSFFTQVLKEVIDLLRLENVVLIGHSMGAQISVKFCVENPKKVRKLVLAAPAGFERFSEREKQSLIDFTYKAKGDALSDAQLFYICSLNYYNSSHPLIHQDVAHLKALISVTGVQAYFSMIRHCQAGMLEEPVYENLQELRIPVQVIFGDGDKLIPNRILHPMLTTEGIASDGSLRIPGSSLHIIRHSGHFVQRETATEFIDILERFLNQ